MFGIFQRIIGDSARHPSFRMARIARGIPRWLANAGHSARLVCVAATLLLGSIATANASCNFTSTVTTGGTIAFSGIGASNQVGFCVTNDTILWGLYGSSNGANPNVNTYLNFPMTAGGLGFSNLTYTTAKATYTLVPVQGPDNAQVPEYDITINSITGSGTDTITLWYASQCSHSSPCFGAAGDNRPTGTDTSFTITVTLPLPPTVTALSPSSGPVTGGTSVTITGTNFTGTTGASSVKFGSVNATSYIVNSATTITAVAPPGTGTVDVTVVNNGQTSATSAADQFTYLPAPTVTSTSPTSGPTAGGTSVTITGTNFLGTTGASSVKFGSANATSYTVNSSTTITAVAPAGTGTVHVTVFNNGQTSTTSSADQFTYVPGPTATTAIASTILTQNHAATSFVPVTGSGGTAPLSYSVSPTLPAGLTMASGTGAITGTPTVTSAATTYTVTVTDNNSATATATFSLTVNAAVTATQAIASTALTQNKAATSFTPVTGGGGTGTLTYGISPSLPTGLNFNTASGAITGTPTVTSSATSYTVTVTDTNSATASNSFTLTVNPAVTATQVIASTTLTQNFAASFTPVTGSGGTGTLSYSVSPGLPSGLSINSSTGAITGTPTVTHATSTFTVTVTDANSATASATFGLTINSAVTATQAVASAILTANHAATTFTPVTGGGGTGTLSYSVSPSLPAGLSFNTSTGAVSGTPTVTSTTATYTVTVTDSVGATATNTFSLTVNGPVQATQAIATVTLTQNKAVTSFTPVTGSGGSPPLSYGVSPSLPAGLSLNTTSGAITGTPTATSGATTYTVTVTDQNTATASASFSLSVNAAVTATQAIASVTLTANHAPSPFTPVTGGGGTAPLSYSVSPSLPAGLSLSTSTGAISGTPTAASSATSYTVTVTDANLATATNTFSLTVNGAVTATQAVAVTTLTVNHAATTFTPVTGGGGSPPLTYAVSPSLPAGLSFNTTNGAVSGTPTATATAANYTVTVTDVNNASASATFSLAVNGAVTATTAVASTTLTQNKAATPFTPVTGSGGTSPLSYGVSPSLPGGLSFNTTNGAITGTPTATLTASSFTVTVTDANGATATANFSLAVNTGVTATTAVPTTVLTANHAATAFTPVTGGGGTPPLTYGVSPTLPAGLTMDTTNGMISGTPTASIGATTFTVTVTDANSATATATFSLTVNGAVTATTAIPSTALVLNTPAASFTPVTGSGGTPPLSYGVSPALPAGLNLDTASGAITGTPTASLAATTFSVTVTDSLGASASANFNLSVGLVTSTVALVSSQNPSSAGQAVTFTATVTGAVGTPTGTVTFNDGGAPIGTATLSGGVAAFTTSSLTVGSHTITASYSGSATFLASTSPSLVQTVNIPVDSVRLRALQLNVTKVVAQNSGQAISGAIDSAIAEGFSEGGELVTPSASGVRFNFGADEKAEATGPSSTASGTDGVSARDGTRSSGRAGGSSRVDDAFAAIDQQMPSKAPPPRFQERKEWLFWIDVRGSGVNRWGPPSSTVGNPATEASMYGAQVNLLAGLTYRTAPNFLVGVLGGYEQFSYTQQDISGKLKGDGWTVGAYLGWKISPTLRYDAAVAYSGIGYDGTAGTAQGNFSGHRWLVSTGLTGTYKLYNLLLEPSAKVYALWEHENAYVDSLGTLQAARDFATGRASAGTKLSYPVQWTDSVLLVPYLGAYGDYYFTQDNAAAIVAEGGIPLASVPLLQGWSARLTGGVGARLASGAMLGLGAEYGGIGSNTQIWTFTGRARMPF